MLHDDVAKINKPNPTPQSQIQTIDEESLGEAMQK
jgi:hypothetical protein